MSKKAKKHCRTKEGVDVGHLERLVEQLLNTDYSIPWYQPDSVSSLPCSHIKKSFMGGYNFALSAVLKGLRGDGGRALRDILSREVVIVRPDDKQEYEEKFAQGAIVIRKF